jgi:hypothetical protein
VILEDAFMKLMKGIWGYASEYVGIGKVSPKGVVDRPKAFVVE